MQANQAAARTGVAARPKGTARLVGRLEARPGRPIRDFEDAAMTWARTHLASDQAGEVRARRLPEIDRVAAEVTARLKREIVFWDNRALRLRDDERAGKAAGPVSAARAVARADELEDRLARRRAELARERDLAPLPPAVPGGAGLRRGERDVQSAMVLYYIKHSIPNEPMPDDLIDTNIRIDYTKLRHLLPVNQRASAGAKRLNGNFDLLRHVIGEGEAEADLSRSFPLDRLDEPENFLSLLYYFGLLSIRGVSQGATRLGIPNQTVRRLMYGYLRDAYRDVGVFSVSHYHFARLVRRMASKGEWRPAVEHIAAAIAEQTGVRDYIDGEKAVQAFLAAHFSVVDQFLIHSEPELNKGYADLHLEPFVAQYPDIGYGYVVEVKYLKRSERVDGSVVAQKLREAREQLAGYLADEGLRRRAPSVRYVGLAVVFHGWELAACEAAEPGAGDEARGQPAPPSAARKAQNPR